MGKGILPVTVRKGRGLCSEGGVTDTHWQFRLGSVKCFIIVWGESQVSLEADGT